MLDNQLGAHELSVSLFFRGLTNLKAQLTKAEQQTVSGGEAALLNAQLAADRPGCPAAHARDLHLYPLAAQVYWAAEGASRAIALLLDTPRALAPDEARSFAELHQHLNETIAYLEQTNAKDLHVGLARTITLVHPRGATESGGAHFLVAFAIPHFYYHLTTAYSILRNQGGQLTMGDFLGSWGTN